MISAPSKQEYKSQKIVHLGIRRYIYTFQEESMSSPALAPSPATVDMKFEIVVIPVSDIDRAKEFYLRLGWRLDADYATDDKDFRVIQFTPPGSSCS